MKIFNKEKRIKYLGFNDFWFIVIGAFILSSITNYLFNDPFQRPSLDLVLISWSVSLFVALCDWLVIRGIAITLRRLYPAFKDTFKRIAILFVSLIFAIILIDFVSGFLVAKFLTFIGYPSTHMTSPKILVPVVLITIMVMAIYEAIYYNVRLQSAIREEEQAKQAIIQAQLDTLRNQAKPHFLFNSFNTLRDIIDVESKENAKEFVDKLSDVYRFILESGNENLTPLQKELKFVKSYVHIQKERFGDNLRVNWEIPEDRLLWHIVPMSLQLLIENAIKHNVASKAKPLIIDVIIENDQLVVSNKIQAKSTLIASTKIGLKNIEKRYALISNDSVEISNDGVDFRVSLPLLSTAK